MIHRYTENDSGASLYELTERYPDEASAVAYFESQRWPEGAYCPKCGSVDVYKGNASRRLPLWRCNDCDHQFTVTSGTVMEGTKLPLRKWLLAFHLMGASKKGMSALQLSRMLKMGYKTAWHLCHRIRATMTDNSQKFTGTVETDEVYIGGRRKHVGKGYRGNKIAVQTIVERSTPKKERNGRWVNRYGRAQTIALDPDAEKVDGRTVGAKLRAHTDPDRTILNTDESPIYDRVGKGFKAHDTVNHKKGEYVKTDPYTGRVFTTNTAEGLFANLRRQITGTHHSTSKKHLSRYLEEFDFKYNNRDKSDGERTVAAIRNMEGKRLRLVKSRRGDGLIDPDRPAHEGKRRGRRKRYRP